MCGRSKPTSEYYGVKLHNANYSENMHFSIIIEYVVIRILHIMYDDDFSENNDVYMSSTSFVGALLSTVQFTHDKT